MGGEGGDIPKCTRLAAACKEILKSDNMCQK